MFLVTGVARSGTSYLCHRLNQVPSIYCVHERMTDLLLSVSDRADFGRIFYADRLEAFFTRQICLDSRNPDLFRFHGIKVPFPDLSLLHLLQVPRLKIIALTRHPLDVFLSQHHCDLGDAPWPREVFTRDGGLYKINIYTNYLNMLSNINPGILLTVKYEDLVVHPEGLQAIGTFLGVDLDGESWRAVLSRQVDFGKRPEGTIHPVHGCLDQRATQDAPSLVFFSELVRKFCGPAMERLGYALP